MEDSKRDEGVAKKIKYVKPELITLDKDKGAEGGQWCMNGSGNTTGCNTGAGGTPPDG
jgi:hypothetical protein